MPFISGIDTSINARSGMKVSTMASASAPLYAVRTSCPSISSSMARASTGVGLVVDEKNLFCLRHV